MTSKKQKQVLRLAALAQDDNFNGMNIQLAKLKNFHCPCRVSFVVSHPFHKEREMDGARSFITSSVKMLSC
jgi:hypothetical protein